MLGRNGGPTCSARELDSDIVRSSVAWLENLGPTDDWDLAFVARVMDGVCVYARGEEKRGEGYRCDKLIVLVCWGKHSHNADCKNHEESPLLVAQNTLVTPILCVNCM